MCLGMWTEDIDSDRLGRDGLGVLRKVGADWGRIADVEEEIRRAKEEALEVSEKKLRSDSHSAC